MAVCPLDSFSLSILSQLPFQFQSHLSLYSLRKMIIDDTRRRRGSGRFSRCVVLSTHYNAEIIKPNQKSRYGRTLNMYDSDEEDYGEELLADDDWLLNDEFAEPAEFEVDGKRIRSQKSINAKQSSQRQLDIRTDKNIQEKCIVVENMYRNESKTNDSMDIDGKGKNMAMKSTENRYQTLFEQTELTKKHIPLLDYLYTFDLKELDFVRIYHKSPSSLEMKVYSAKAKLDYLLSVGVKRRDIRRIMLRQPHILKYSVKNNLMAHVSFLMGLGIPNSRIGQIITASPCIFSYGIENSLKPTVRYLVEEVGIHEKYIGKVVQLSPQILSLQIDIAWNTRCIFLSEELGASKDSVTKMVKKHPQFLHYSIYDGLLPRINFLRSIGMRNSEILEVLTRLTQVFSLSVEDNLMPKCMYFFNELRHEVQSLTKYPTYLSLSLKKRIRPRHKFLVKLRKAPKGPFPLKFLLATDACFCEQWARSTVDKYLAYRQQLLIKEFLRRHRRRG